MTVEPSEKPRSLASRLRQHPLTALRDEMDDLFSRFFGEAGAGWMPARMCLALDLSETDESVDVYLDLPGIDPKDIDIRLRGQTLTVTGARRLDHEAEGHTYHRVERYDGQFSRTIPLPCLVDEESVKAEYKDGVLAILLPKSGESKGRRIKVKRLKDTQKVESG